MKRFVLVLLFPFLFELAAIAILALTLAEMVDYVGWKKQRSVQK